MMGRLLLVFAITSSSLLADALERGLAAKQKGQLDIATRELATAAQEHPRRPEVWMHYGTVLGWQQRHDEALEVIDKGLAIAPRDFDLRLAKARIHAWKADHAEASRQLESLAQQHPNNTEVLVMQGRVAQWSGKPASASRYYEAALKLDPNQVDALTGLGDLAAERRQTDLARRHYEAALAIDPSADNQLRLERLDSNNLSVDFGTGISTFEGSARDDWWNAWLQIGQGRESGHWWLRVQQEERFQLQDTSVATGWHRGWDELALSLEGGGSPDADWAARWFVQGGIAWQPMEDPWPWWVMDLRHSEYLPRDVTTLRFGIDQALGNGWQLGLRWIHLEFQGADATDGWLLSLERQISEDWWWRIGTARAVESLSANTLTRASTLDSQTWFAGIRGPLAADWHWRLDFEREDVDGAPDRNGISLCIHHEF